MENHLSSIVLLGCLGIDCVVVRDNCLPTKCLCKYVRMFTEHIRAGATVVQPVWARMPDDIRAPFQNTHTHIHTVRQWKDAWRPLSLLCNGFVLLQPKLHRRSVLHSSFSENSFVGLHVGMVRRVGHSVCVCVFMAPAFCVPGMLVIQVRINRYTGWTITVLFCENDWTKKYSKTKKKDRKSNNTPPWCGKMLLSQRLECFKCKRKCTPPPKSLSSGNDYGLRVALLYRLLQVSVSWCHVRNMNVTASYAYWSWVMFDFPFQLKERKMELTGNITSNHWKVIVL